MKLQVLEGIGGLMLILSSFSISISYLDHGSWAAPTDFRWVLVVLGIISMVVANLLSRRTGIEDET